MRIREWQNGERAGTTIDIEADSLGHDLAWGSSTFSRTITTSAAPADETFPQTVAADSDAPTDAAAPVEAVEAESVLLEDEKVPF